MKQLPNSKTNFHSIENFLRKISKGYYSDFIEYEPDHTLQEENNDHTTETEENDHTEAYSVLKNKKNK